MRVALIVMLVALTSVLAIPMIDPSNYLDDAKDISNTETRYSIDTNRTWDASGSPYIITGTMYVNKGSTLTIEAGVTVQFNGNYQFIVGGTLIVNGTAADPVLFKSQYTPWLNRWWGIQINSTGKIQANYLNISSVYAGVYADNGGSIRLENTTIMWSYYGVYLSYTQNAILEHCTFDTAYYQSVYAYYAHNLRINGSTFHRTTGSYYTNYPYFYYTNYVYFCNNSLYRTVNYVYFYRCDYATICYNTIDYCDSGFYIRYNRWNVIKGNSISNCQYYHMYIYGSGTYDYYDHDVDLTNTVDGKTVLYLKNQNGLTYDGQDFGDIYLIRSDNIQVKNTDLNNRDMLLSFDSDNVLFKNVNSSNMMYGFYIYYGSTITIDGCRAYRNDNYGLYVVSANNVIINDTRLDYNNYGMYFSSCPNSVLTNLNLNNNWNYGARIYNCDLLTLKDSAFFNNNYYSLYVEGWNPSNFDWTVSNVQVDKLPMAYFKNTNDFVITSLNAGFLMLYNCVNVTVSNNDLSWRSGACFAYLHDSLITQNDFTHLGYRIFSIYIYNTEFSYNSLMSRQDYSMYSVYWYDCIISNNIFSRDPNYYSSGWQFEQLYNCHVLDNSFSNYAYNIQCNYFCDGEIQHNTFRYADYGLYLNYPHNSEISDNSFCSNNYGLYSYDSEWMTIASNTFYACRERGIYLNYCPSGYPSTIRDNTIYGNATDWEYGIFLENTMYDLLLRDNLIQDCDVGIQFNSEFYNMRFWYNGIINCGQDVYENSWYGVSFDDGSLGNYYSAWNTPDMDGNGIVDVPYVFNGNSQDNYPCALPLPDRDSPIITLLNPTTGYISNNDEISFSVVDPTLSSVEYSIEGSAFATFFPPYSIKTYGWADDLYNVSVKANDRYNHIVTSTFPIIVDSTNPTITFVGPGYEIEPGQDLEFAILDANMGTATYSLGGGSAREFDTKYIIDTSNWMAGVGYAVDITARDLAQNTVTKTFLITVKDIVAPKITLLSPSDGAVISGTTVISFSIIDDSLKNASVSINGISSAFLMPFLIPAQDLAEGANNIKVTALDTYGNKGELKVAFIVDKTAPSIGLISPAVGSHIRSGATLKFNVTDANLLSVTYQHDSDTATLAAPYNIDTTGWTGSGRVTIIAKDKAGYVTYKDFDFDLDNLRPNVISSAPKDGSTVPIPANIKVEFSEAMAHASLSGAVGIMGVNFTISWSLETLMITPDAPLSPGTKYTMAIGDQATDLAGNKLMPFVLEFTTKSASAGPAGDSDRDGMPDLWESQHGLDPKVNDTSEDLDGDGLTNLEEYQIGTGPDNTDSDGDMMPDGWEADNGLDPLDASDGSADPDGDGFSNNEEYTKGTDPKKENDHPSVGSSKAEISYLPYVIAVIIILAFIALLIFVFLTNNKPDVPPEFMPEETVAPKPKEEPPKEEPEPEVPPPPPAEPEERHELEEPAQPDAIEGNKQELLPPASGEPEGVEMVEEEPERPEPEKPKKKIEIQSWDMK